MTPEERRRGAFEQFDQLLREGTDLAKAVSAAADDNELKPEIFREVATRHLGDLERYRERMILRADHDRIVVLAADEIEKCASRLGSYKESVDFWFTGAEEAITAAVSTAVGRQLTDHEIRTIEEMYDAARSVSVPELRPVLERLRELKRSRV